MKVSFLLFVLTPKSVSNFIFNKYNKPVNQLKYIIYICRYDNIYKKVDESIIYINIYVCMYLCMCSNSIVIEQ